MRLIDADALIAEYDRVHVGEPGGARKLMENAPTIEPEHLQQVTGKLNWIPVSEALPELEKDVLVTTENGYIYIANYDKVFDKTGWFESIECYELDVIAWQPLPEPYREES